jgi:type IV secretory pathway TrbL component
MVARSVGLLIGCTLLIWGLVAYPAWRLVGDGALIQSAAAMLACLVPAAATLAFTCWAFRQTAEQQVLAVFGGTGVRMLVVLGIGWLMYSSVPMLQAESFWFWLVFFYLVTLAAEVGLVLRGQAKVEARSGGSAIEKHA